jgi:hypothetical protein
LLKAQHKAAGAGFMHNREQLAGYVKIEVLTRCGAAWAARCPAATTVEVRLCWICPTG